MPYSGSKFKVELILQLCKLNHMTWMEASILVMAKQSIIPIFRLLPTSNQLTCLSIQLCKNSFTIWRFPSDRQPLCKNGFCGRHCTFMLGCSKAFRNTISPTSSTFPHYNYLLVQLYFLQMLSTCITAKSPSCQNYRNGKLQLALL